MILKGLTEFCMTAVYNISKSKSIFLKKIFLLFSIFQQYNSPLVKLLKQTL